MPKTGAATIQPVTAHTRARVPAPSGDGQEMSRQARGEDDVRRAHGRERVPRTRQQPDGERVERRLHVVVAPGLDLLPLADDVARDDPGKNASQ